MSDIPFLLKSLGANKLFPSTNANEAIAAVYNCIYYVHNDEIKDFDKIFVGIINILEHFKGPQKQEYKNNHNSSISFDKN